MRIVFPFDMCELPTLDEVGGKALALMQMTTAGMPVPPGFVLSVKFFEPWMNSLEQAPEWAALAKTGENILLEMEQNAKALQTICHSLRFTQQQKIEIHEALEQQQQKNSRQLYAVRSSAPEEDLEGASFAGGYETILGVTTENMEAAILRAFASAFDARVFLYKKEHGFRLDQPRIAVVVQQQVDAESAGVGFSLNPLNNCFDEVVINASYGLGEAVVAGEVDPDMFVVDKLKLEIIETRIGKKQAVVRLKPEGGTSQSIRPSSPEACITSAQVLELTQQLKKVEAFYQKPVDIEWAIVGEKVFLLQARPITTYLPLPDVMVTAPGQPKRLYANSTLIEQGLQEPLSVLGTDFLSYVLPQVTGPLGDEGIGPGKITFTASGGYYMNISYAMKLGMGKAALAPGSIGDPQVMAILENIDMQQYLAGELPGELRVQRSKLLFSMLPLIKSVLMAYLKPEEILQKYQAALPEAVKRFEIYSGTGLSVQAQAIALTGMLRFFYDGFGIPMILAAQLAQQRIKNLFKQDPVQDHLVNLGISLPGNKTTEMGERMYSLAASAEINRYASAGDFLAALERSTLERGTQERAPLERETTLPADFMRSWQYFMDEYGMRCPGEIDPATPRPKEQPALVFEQLKNMSLAIHSRNGAQPFFEEARAKREAAYQALYTTARQKGKRQAKAFEKYYKIWVTLGGYRETPKHYVIKVIDMFRRSVLEIAQTFVQEGRFDAPEQIFELTITDIDRALADPTLNLRALAQERTQLIRKIKKSHRVVRIMDSRGRIYDPPRKATIDGELKGMPISPGVVQGRVKVLRYAAEKKLLPGEILVARATDPGWTPLFINARGIILEIGGALQHGAVVAREYGIPCVSGVDDATTKLLDGQLAEVDGSNGVVRLLA